MKIYNDYGINDLLTEDAWISPTPPTSPATIRMVSLVEQMLVLHKQLPESQQASRKNCPASDQIEATDGVNAGIKLSNYSGIKLSIST